MVDTPSALPDPAAGAKLALRDQLGTARKRVPLAEVVHRAEQIADHALATPEVARAASVGLYVSMGHEPGTGVLLDRLFALGKRVLLPVVLPNLDLDWAAYTGPGSLAPARMGLLEPRGSRLGVEAIATCDAVLVPGVGVDGTGMRLGRGGGCYDRALARVPMGTFVAVVLYSAEIINKVPSSAHDLPVGAAITDSGVTRF